MPSLIDIRRRIRSVKNTQQITKAMKMVSAAKLRRAQDRVIAARPYAAALRKMMANVAAAAAGSDADEPNALLDVRPEKHVLLVLVTGDKGLAGAFNSNLIKAASRFSAEHGGVDVTFELVGRKGRDFFRKRTTRISGDQINLAAKPVYSEVAAIAQRAMKMYRDGEIDAVYLLYNEFKSVISQKVMLSRVLPVESPNESADPASGADPQVREGRPRPAGDSESRGAAAIDYIFEQPPGEMLAALLPRYVEVEFYRALLESSAAEHAARMTAMDAATSNAADVIDSLTLHLNRVRQASITKEIIEVVSGAAAAE
jgi:F-type H+-transporting ATPase subunit gamma